MLEHGERTRSNIGGSPALATGRAAIRLFLKCLLNGELHKEMTTGHDRSVARDELLGRDGAHLMLALGEL